MDDQRATAISIPLDTGAPGKYRILVQYGYMCEKDRHLAGRHGNQRMPGLRRLFFTIRYALLKMIRQA